MKTTISEEIKKIIDKHETLEGIWTMNECVKEIKALFTSTIKECLGEDERIIEGGLIEAMDIAKGDFTIEQNTINQLRNEFRQEIKENLRMKGLNID